MGIRLEKAKDDVARAGEFIAIGAYRQAISRAYYAVFAIASAVLLTIGQKRKKHSGIESAFNYFLVKPGLIEPEYGAIYIKAYRARQDADYADTTDFTKAKARQAFTDAEKFVERVEKYLREVGAIS
ncbi:MAG: HEPN domain-containing protein [Chloroflexi bacterium]|nr:HEPN domain-containing protein [Chloroflexota bacterium]